MCYMNKKKKPKRKNHKPSKKSRTKTRKPKFLSLISLELSKKQQSTTDMPSTASAAAAIATATSSNNGQQQQRNLFPLHPENTDENMAYLFSAADGAGAASTLTGLLGTSTTTSSSCSESASISYAAAYGSEIKEAVALVRTALRNKERDSSEERYVRYSEVVERRDEEVTSSAAVDLKCGNRNLTVKIEKKEKQSLSLKLDYEEILNAWSNKGPLYIVSEDSPQIVPNIHDNFLAPGLSNGISDASLWSVPELSISNPNIHEMKKEEEEQHAGVGLEEWKLGKRKASVLRYKEKRQNRLFSKQIRYQVRKLNAEKRPRVKGRFVKKS